MEPEARRADLDLGKVGVAGVRQSFDETFRQPEVNPTVETDHDPRAPAVVSNADSPWRASHRVPHAVLSGHTHLLIDHGDDPISRRGRRARRLESCDVVQRGNPEAKAFAQFRRSAGTMQKIDRFDPWANDMHMRGPMIVRVDHDPKTVPPQDRRHSRPSVQPAGP